MYLYSLKAILKQLVFIGGIGTRIGEKVGNIANSTMKNKTHTMKLEMREKKKKKKKKWLGRKSTCEDPFSNLRKTNLSPTAKDCI